MEAWKLGTVVLPSVLLVLAVFLSAYFSGASNLGNWVLILALLQIVFTASALGEEPEGTPSGRE